ncbi:tetratricopeptide repeat protein [Enhygromyxa salina]|uniref:FecR protein domain-containing protein n=1 Tax=Enhygromyxa salina TaxID=215803 RepID=A0A2S9YM28_9BACT|nr:hypothetical protein [Enhygromyxa salina]PRQ06149.1 hypothetical protein ENSA7_41830 [Enhygromyxa salina]
MTGRQGDRVDAALSLAFTRLGGPGALGDELGDDELLAGLFDDDERASFEAHTAKLSDPASACSGDDDPPTPERRRSWPRMVALGLSVAACALLLVAINALGPSTHAQPELPTPRTGASAAMTNAQSRPVGWALPGERHELRGDDCRRVAADVSLCSRGAARFRVNEGSTETAVALELESGELELDARSSSASIVLSTAAGRVIQLDRSSQFRVAFDRVRELLQVEVITGEVIVEDQDGDGVSLGAGDQLDLGPAPAQPASAAPNPQPVPTPVPQPGPKPAQVEPARADSPDQLLAAAQRELAAGERKAAVRLYRELVDHHGASEAGRTARVSLGRILLAADDHHAALAEFEAYLDDAGGRRSLVEEARYGRIRCLRGLHRALELREAIDEFEARHPSSLHLRRLADWRRELEAPAP